MADNAEKIIENPGDKPPAEFKAGLINGPTAVKKQATPVGATDEYLFFNVMPKMGSSGPLIQPSVKVLEQNTEVLPKEGGKIKKMLNKYKISIILIVLILVVGGGVYVYFTKFSQPDLEQILVMPGTKNQGGVKSSSSTPALLNAETDKAWQKKFFENEVCTHPDNCGNNADPDNDGLANSEEYKLGTEPNNKDTDQDGLADGDEVHIFLSDPKNPNTGPDKNFTDLDYAKGGYDFATDQKMTPEQITKALSNMKQYKLHEPTLTQLKDYLQKTYNYSKDQPVATSSQPTALPQQATSTPAASTTSPAQLADKQDRDIQRSSAIQNIGIALIKFHRDTGIYPNTSDFLIMFNQVKPYLKVATRPDDPLNKDPYVYTYSLINNGSDYTLSFFSEVAGQVIKKHSQDALNALNQEELNAADDRRKTDLESMKNALMLYSAKNAGGSQDNVFPPEDKYKSELAPKYIAQIPVDPKTGQDYLYQVSETFDTFTLKAVLDSPAKGTTGYLCNQDDCRTY